MEKYYLFLKIKGKNKKKQMPERVGEKNKKKKSMIKIVQK